MRIVILEDNSDCRNVMSSVLADMFPSASVEFFVTSHQMIDDLSATIAEGRTVSAPLLARYVVPHQLESSPIARMHQESPTE